MGIETLATASLVGSAVGGLTSAFGSLFGGAGQQAAYNYKAQVALNNKKIAEQNARYALQAGENEALISGMKTRAQLGTTLARQGASGLDVNSGSAVDVRESEAEIGSFNQMMIRANAARTSYGYKTQAMNFQAEAVSDKMAGENAMTAGEIGGLSSLIGGGTAVADKWYKFTEAGAL